MPRLPDLVHDSKLATEHKDGSTIHSMRVSDATHYRGSRIEHVHWEEGRNIGSGGQGSVHIERRLNQVKSNQPEVRAVKRIRGATHRQYLHELEAIAKFSHPQVSMVQKMVSRSDGDAV